MSRRKSLHEKHGRNVVPVLQGMMAKQVGGKPVMAVSSRLHILNVSG